MIHSSHLSRHPWLGKFLLGCCLLLVLAVWLVWQPSQPAEAERNGRTAVIVRDDDGNPIDGQVRFLCYAADDGPLVADLQYEVLNGLPKIPLPANCHFVAALHVQHVQAAGKPDRPPAYTVYHTSWAPGTRSLAPLPGTVVVDSEYPLTLFHVLTSIGWQPNSQSDILTPELFLQSLRIASANLYDVTEGQMAFGPVDITTNGERWDQADFRILPANDLRPSTFVGGIVKDILKYNGIKGDSDYTPATIYLGRAWSGTLGVRDPRNHTWVQQPTGPQTLIHEWGHYALFFYDEYQQVSGAGDQYCICDDLPGGCGLGARDGSIMGYHYSASELWHFPTHKEITASSNNICMASWNWHFHDATDWGVLNRWPIIQELPSTFDPIILPDVLVSGPNLGLVADLFNREPGHAVYLPLTSGGSGPAPFNPQEIELAVTSNSLSYASGPLVTQLYLLEGGADNPSRILYQGKVRGDATETGSNLIGRQILLGASGEDRLRLYVEQYGGDNDRLHYPGEAGFDPEPFSLSELQISQTDYAYTLTHRFEIQDGQISKLKVHIETDVLGNAPTIQLCSMDAAVGCHPDWLTTATSTRDGWQAEFEPLSGLGYSELPRYLTLRVFSDEPSPAFDAIQWLRVAGGVGPGHGDIISPLLDSEITVNSEEELANYANCNLVSFAPAANAYALAEPLPDDVEVMVGQPLLVRISLTSDDCFNYLPEEDSVLDLPLLLNFAYDQAELDLLGIDEAGLTLMWFAGNGWENLGIIGQSTDLNWVAGRINWDGIYAVGVLKPDP